MKKILIPSYLQNAKNLTKIRPYLFFHIPKSAGMSLVSGITSCFEEMKRELPYQVWYGRSDSPKAQDDQVGIQAARQCIQEHGADSVGGFIGSHSPMMVVEEAQIEFKMITVLRSTVDRVLSAFSYDCMRCNKIPSAIGLQEFINRPKQINVTVKTLLGIESLTGGEADIAANLLKEYFYAYCFIEDINLLISSILSLENLPNLHIGRENRTIDTFRYQPTDSEILQIKQLNQEDEALINTLGYGSLKLPEYSRSHGISEDVVRVGGRQTNDRYGYHSKLQKLRNLQVS